MNELSARNLYPCSGAHAVQNAAFGIEWSTELSDAEMHRVAQAHQELKKDLREIQISPNVVLKMGAPGMAPAVQSQSMGAVAFSSHGAGPLGVRRALEVQREKCVVQINDYTRWAQVWEQTRAWFAVVLPLLDRRKISAIGIQYNDVFHWRDKPSAFRPEYAFRQGSRLLPPHVFELKGLWHSHNGYYLDRDRPTAHRLLENMNIAVTEAAGQRSVQITTVHKAKLSEVWGWSDLVGILDPLMNDLHDRNKMNLSEILSDEVVEMIRLKGGDND